MAKTKSAGRARQGTPRKGRRLGLKAYSGKTVKIGNIILRQIGSSVHAGKGVKRGRDFTLYAIKDGTVNFKTLRSRKYVEVI